MLFRFGLLFLICWMIFNSNGETTSILLENSTFQPLVIEEQENGKLISLPPDRIDNTEKIQFSSNISNGLKVACPAKNQEQQEMNNNFIHGHKNARMLLFENPNKSHKSCTQVLKTSITYSEVTRCGIENEALFYHVGYWVKLWNYANKTYYQDQKFVTIYGLCSSENQKMFARHYVYLGFNNRTKISSKELKKMEFDKFGKLFLRLKYKTFMNVFGQEIYQLVPYDDMIPNAWKISTLLDINVIFVKNKIKNDLDKIDQFIRDLVLEEEGQPLTVYSGIEYNEKSIILYWKVVIRNTKGVAIGISTTVTQPCEDSEVICEEAGLGNMKIEGFFCCYIDKQLVTRFELLKRNETPLYEVVTELLSMK